MIEIHFGGAVHVVGDRRLLHTIVRGFASDDDVVDVAFTQAVFSFVPPSLIERAVTFRQGEALIAGKISPQPALLRFGARITEEGGADVPVTWAAAR